MRMSFREGGGDRTSIHLQLRHGKSFIDLESESLAFKRVSNSLQTPKAKEPQDPKKHRPLVRSKYLSSGIKKGKNIKGSRKLCLSPFFLSLCFMKKCKNI